MISLHLLAAFVFPAELRNRFLADLGPIIVCSNILGSILLGSLIRREKLLLNEAASLRIEAQTDPLTDLINRRRLAQMFAGLPAQHPPHRGRATIYFDIDHFKQINDRYGHQAGDTVLRTISERVATCLRPNDLFSRLGGDEFLVVLPDIWRSGAHQVAERCRTAIAQAPITHEGVQLDITISVGLHWATATPDFESELAIADEALYLAKDRGRDCVAVRSGSTSSWASPHSAA